MTDLYFQKYRDALSQWRWRLVAQNGRTIADSGEGYSSEAGCDHGIALVQSTTLTTPVYAPAGHGLLGSSMLGGRF